MNHTQPSAQGVIRGALRTCVLCGLIACGTGADDRTAALAVPAVDSAAAAPDSVLTMPDSAAFLTVRGQSDLIRIDSPRPGDVVTSPVTITGRARGNWFFEASFPVTLTDWNGLIIAEHYATAKGEWMTTEFVPFEAVIAFAMPKDIGDFSRRGSLILQKSNPSGLASADDALEFTVFFRQRAP